MSSQNETIMLIVGDVYVIRDDPPSVMQHVKAFLNSADIVLGNLEGAYADSGTPWPKGEINVWRANAKQMEAIEAGGFDAMSCTNNHIMDFGYDGLYETLGHLDRLGVKHSGAGRNATEAYAPAIVERDGAKVAMLAYSSVFAPGWDAREDRGGLAVMHAKTAYEPPVRINENPGRPPKILTWLTQESKDQLARDVAAARKLADIVVCSFHWGISNGYIELADYQVELGHLAIDVGADLVFGHHPHALQGIEVYKGKAIFYSLGNFSFARHKLSAGHELETAIIRCRIRDRKIAAVEYLPTCGDEKLDPHLLSLADGSDVIKIVEKRSAAFGTKFSEAGDAIKVI